MNANAADLFRLLLELDRGRAPGAAPVATRRALAHEVRSALNLVELALSAHEKRDAGLRDHLVRSVELPLLESMARGIFGKELSPEEAERLSRSIPREAAEDAEMMTDAEGFEAPNGAETSALSSRVAARMESLRILASHTRDIPWIRWQVRLERVKGELICLLESSMSAAEVGESLAAGRGV